ncbi:MAG TPA: UDP-N-acetylmuramate--L-alanine ligase [Kiritimatiellia bacterium]|nr:UDP-N-acetylmuramate--L-alanine ligase [Kiritimatiellia bacterium]HSA17283.1 UDP-N-acetylmuramate--L-alanine ligase [Kiritimatiellia bacterium]
MPDQPSGFLLPQPGERVHLLGIGGVGMAGLAVHLDGRGARVSGCDAGRNRLTDDLERRGIRCVVGHDPAHLEPDVKQVVRSTAVPDSCEELRAARARGMPVLSRGSVLAALLEGRLSVAVGGTHGKTTTTAMIAQALRHAGLDPGFCIGGEVDELGGVAGVGDGRLLVVEADESDGTLALYRPDIALVTNIELDHLEHFDGEAGLIACFGKFVRGTRRKVIYCADDPRASSLCRSVPNALSYGWAPGAEVRGLLRASSPAHAEVEVRIKGRRAGVFRLPVAGPQNAQNALAACAAAIEAGLTFEQAAAGLAEFRPAKRRFEIVAEMRGVTVVSDYAHHPTEIRAMMRVAAGRPARRRLAVFQPHRYTRTRALGPEFPPAFAGADEIWLLPVYAASEAPLEGGTSEDLLGHFRAFGGPPVRLLRSLEDAREQWRGWWKDGDLLLVIGAGDVEKIAWWAKDDLIGGNTGEDKKRA